MKIKKKLYKKIKRVTSRQFQNTPIITINKLTFITISVIAITAPINSIAIGKAYASGLVSAIELKNPFNNGVDHIKVVWIL